MAKKKYYAVARGHTPGIYKEWYGENGAEIQIQSFSDALYKGFSTIEDAETWLTNPEIPSKKLQPEPKPPENPITSEVLLYTDGACIGNPGPGGYGLVLLYGTHRKELSGGFRQTTNNRMELIACIVGLRALKRKCSVTLYSDSQYVVNAICKGWIKRWQSKNWMLNSGKERINTDLWKQLLNLCKIHEVRFVWVRGHAGNPENERCDQLATHAASQPDLPPDIIYEDLKSTSGVQK